MQQWHELETLKGYSLMAADGEIGTITDVWFDDDRWTVLSEEVAARMAEGAAALSKLAS